MYIQKLHQTKHAPRSTLTTENSEQLKNTRKLAYSNRNKKKQRSKNNNKPNEHCAFDESSLSTEMLRSNPAME